jgi:hypothetical protein
MRNDAVKNALGESYTEPFRLSTFILPEPNLIVTFLIPVEGSAQQRALVAGGWAETRNRNGKTQS